LITTKTKMFLIGRTGLGKTMFGFGIACVLASDADRFLHWPSSRPARVLYIDGEMPDELIKARSIDTLRRAGIAPKPRYLTIYSRDMEEEFLEKFPDLGPMPPLNTKVGHQWVLALIAALGGVDVVILDNVMSLCEGDQKEETTWSGALPLVHNLSSRRIAQIWLDHTGHAGGHQYGTSTKSWRFDTLGMMLPLPKEQSRSDDVAFTLSFDPELHGKARRRTPDNRDQFQTVTIRLSQDQWTSEPADNDGNSGSKCAKPNGKAPSPSRMKFYDALVAAIGRSPTARNSTTMEAWEGQCLHRGLIDPPPPEGTKEGWQRRGARTRDLRTAKSDLIRDDWIAVDGDIVIDLKGKW
jgi:hypothetical protein